MMLNLILIKYSVSDHSKTTGCDIYVVMSLSLSASSAIINIIDEIEKSILTIKSFNK